VFRVLAAMAPAAGPSDAANLFPPEQAHVGACTAKATIYNAHIAAGPMLGQFTRWLRHLPVEANLLLNLLSMELTVLAQAAG
jgi:hypothetical protein